MGEAHEPRSGYPINATIEVFGDRWSLLVLRTSSSETAATSDSCGRRKRGSAQIFSPTDSCDSVPPCTPAVRRVQPRLVVGDQRVAVQGVLHHSVNLREHKDLAFGWESGIGTTGQYPRQDLIPGNMDDGFHLRDDEAVLGVRATRVSGWEAK